MKTGFPAWAPAVLYLLTCLFFHDPLQNVVGLAAVLILYLSATTTGRWIGGLFGNQNKSLAFPLGLGFLLLLVFAIGSWNASQPVIWSIWIFLAALAIPSIRELRQTVPRYCLWGIPFFSLAVWSSFTPTTFYDALAYNMGIPYQYLAYEKIGTFSTWTTSYFPPFDQVVKFLFLVVAPQNAIKLFSCVLYVHSLRVLVSVKPHDLESKFVVIPLLLLPVPWILLHIVNPDLLNSFFFVAAICVLWKAENYRSIALSAIFLAFTCWTKYTMYPYLIVVPLLIWRSGMSVPHVVKRAILYGLVFVICLSPLYVRNIVLKNDPLYPLLHKIFPTDWQEKQTAAVQKEFPTPGNWPEFARRIFLTPFLITFQMRSYGSASEIGFLPLLGLVLLPLSFRRLKVPLVLFVFLCYLIWIYQLYHFRYFLPLYLISLLFLGYSFQVIGQRLRAIILLLWIAAVGWGLYVSLPVLRLFPLISPKESRQDYLAQRVQYFEAAQFLNGNTKGERTIMVGETRNAYFRGRLVPFSYTDQDPLLKWSRTATSSDDLYRKLKSENVGFILYNPSEMKRLQRQYGIWQATREENSRVSELLRDHGRIVFSKKGVTIIEIR